MHSRTDISAIRCIGTRLTLCLLMLLWVQDLTAQQGPPRPNIPLDLAHIHHTFLEEGRVRIWGDAGSLPPEARAWCTNLHTGQTVLSEATADGHFEVRLFAPPGTWVQIAATYSDRPPGVVEEGELDPRTGPGLILLLASSSEAQGSPLLSGFCRRTEGRLRLWGHARITPTELQPRQSCDVTLDLTLAGPPLTSAPDRFALELAFQLTRLFDASGFQQSPVRTYATTVLTPLGLPIESEGELIRDSEKPPEKPERPGNGKDLRKDKPPYHRGDNSISIGHRFAIAHRRSSPDPQSPVFGLQSSSPLRIPDLPDGIYQLTLRVWSPDGVVPIEEHLGQLPEWEFMRGMPLGLIRVGNPPPPRLAWLLLGSALSEGSRGTIAEEDWGRYNLAPRNVYQHHLLIIPRLDPWTEKPRRYRLEPYLPLTSLTNRPYGGTVSAPMLPFRFPSGRLRVRVRHPDGSVQDLGSAPFIAGRNDLLSMRPDLAVLDRRVPAWGPAFGNPSLADIFSLTTGDERFLVTFPEYGEYSVEMTGWIEDQAGVRYTGGGSYRVFVARPLDLDLGLMPGTPLQVGDSVAPCVQVQPGVPASIEMEWTFIPDHDLQRQEIRQIEGRANAFGWYAPAETWVRAEIPGEYLLDVTARYVDEDGVWWMASKRGASVVETPRSPVVIHGERGIRSPHAVVRPRWFRMGDGRFFVPDLDYRDPEQRLRLGHVCSPYESGDVAWLHHTGFASIFPGITFTDPSETWSNWVLERWPQVREGEGRQGLYPWKEMPEDRVALGEMPFASSTSTGRPVGGFPEETDRRGYFYSSSWRPGVEVRMLVAEDMLGTGYWFFDDPYGYQQGVGANSDLPGDVKMLYAGSVMHDAATGATHYGIYGSMIVFIDEASDPLGNRVLPPFDGLLPGSYPSGPLLEIDGEPIQLFMTFTAVRPGTLLTVGDLFHFSGYVWPPLPAEVRVHVGGPAEFDRAIRDEANRIGYFYAPESVWKFERPGIYRVEVGLTYSGDTSAGNIAENVDPADHPTGTGLGLKDGRFPLIVLPEDAPRFTFDLSHRSWHPAGEPIILRGQVPDSMRTDEVHLLVTMPGILLEERTLRVSSSGEFVYRYDERRLAGRFPNLDVYLHDSPERVRCDTVHFLFYAQGDDGPVATDLLLQGEELIVPFASAGVQEEEETRREGDKKARKRDDQRSTFQLANPSACQPLKSGPMALSSDGSLFAVHPYAGTLSWISPDGKVDRVEVGKLPWNVTADLESEDVYVSLRGEDAVLHMNGRTLEVYDRWTVPDEPCGLLLLPESRRLFVTSFGENIVSVLDARTGTLLGRLSVSDKPRGLAFMHGLLSVSHLLTGDVTLISPDPFQVVAEIPAPANLGSLEQLVPDPTHPRLYLPQIRTNPRANPPAFDNLIFPIVAALDLAQRRHLGIIVYPDIVGPITNQPVDGATDGERLWVVNAGSDSLTMYDLQTGDRIGDVQDLCRTPKGVLLDAPRGRLSVVSFVDASVLFLDAFTLEVTRRIHYTEDPTDPEVRWGRYLFQTANLPELTKDRWIACVNCHPDGRSDGRVWDFGTGPRNTLSLLDSIATEPLHTGGNRDELADSEPFVRMIMAGHGFIPRERWHPPMGPSNAGLSPEWDAMERYVGTLSHADFPPPEPADSLWPSLRRGQDVFRDPRRGCSRCHPAPYYTDRRRHDVGTTTERDSPDLREGGLDTPTLLGLRRSAPYLHDGRASTLQDMLSLELGGRHGRTEELSGQERSDLVNFLLWLPLSER